MKRFAWLLSTGLALAGATVTAPASADVKQGVDAWQRGDYEIAVQEWRPLAISGDADAQFNLGQAYKLGRGVPVSLIQAEQWYKRAAMQGHAQAEDNYGLVMFQNGKRKESLPWLEKSSARGEPRAQYILGTALFNGDIIEKDWTRAYALMSRASASGLPQASQTLVQMDQFIPLDQRQKATAIARDLELNAMKPQPPVVAKAVVPASVPGTSYAAPGTKPQPKAAAKAPDKPKPVAVAAPAKAKPAPSAPKPVVVATKPTAPAKASGGWRVQLGAFSDQARAKAQWSALQAKVKGLSALPPHYAKAGAITRLQAGAFADRAAAERQCTTVKAAGQPCLPVKP